jgi:hypothetical protein
MMRHATSLFMAGGISLGITLTAGAAGIPLNDWEDPETRPWTEVQEAPPAFPEEANLREFYVSGATRHRFFIDQASLQPGQDGVVRYVLVIRSEGGATNISFEGIRCATHEFKIYAIGRQDRNWSTPRQSPWRLIENKPMNRQHAALSRELFCPNGLAIRSAAEGREALRMGKHPDVH